MNKNNKAYEPLLMVWDYYDGPRSGVAMFEGKPHYFESKFNEEIDNYQLWFSLYLVSNSFVETARRQWGIYREWEYKFHKGEESTDNHPGKRGVDQTYDELEDRIQAELRTLEKRPGKYLADFRTIAGQEGLPKGMMRNLEAQWEIEVV